MKAKTSDLTGPALDWAAAKADKRLDQWGVCAPVGFLPSTDWSQGGPIIEAKGISVFRYNKLDPAAPWVWGAHKVVQRPDWRGDPLNVALTLDGPTPLVAAMRCFVTIELGDEVDIPEELLA